MTAKQAKLVAILLAIASILALAAAVITYRVGALDYTALGGGVALAALAAYCLQLARQRR